MNLTQCHLWVSGQGGYHTYRIPALAVTAAGTVLAFCEGRAESMSDTGRIDMLVRRSTDGGATWSVPKIVWSDGNTCGNPCPIVDRATGVVWLLMTWNRSDDPQRDIEAGTSRDTRRVFVASSADDGLTWSAPREITADVKPADWTWYATGPGVGIQLQRGAHAGRLVAPCDHRRRPGDPWMGAHTVYSDDHGASWRLGGIVPGGGVNECELVERVDGSLLLNMRNYERTTPARQVAESRDGGLTWEGQRYDLALIEPLCQAAIHRHSWPAGGKPGVILFSNPASERDRVAMTVRASFDEGATWPAAKLLDPGFGAYSDLAVLADGTILCLHETGAVRKYSALTLSRFSLDWLLA
jgi:sialidase-1